MNYYAKTLSVRYVKVRNEKARMTWKSTIETAIGETAGIPTWCCSTLTVMTRHTAGSTIDKVPRNRGAE